MVFVHHGWLPRGARGDSKILETEDYQPMLADVEDLDQRTTLIQKKAAPSHLSWIICLFLVLTNIISVYKLLEIHAGGSESTQFAGLKYEYPIVYTDQSDYTSTNSTTAHNAWTSIDTSPLQVALDDNYAHEHGLIISKFRWPWDENKGVYFLRAFHDLHCLKSIRKGYDDAIHGRRMTISPAHTFHCLDSLRQYVQCHADDTPMPLVKEPGEIGFGQVHMCRNINNLIRWSGEGVRSACYHRFSDYDVVRNKIEMFAFCPKDSPAYVKMQAYFSKYGHEDLDWVGAEFTVDPEPGSE